LDWITRPRPDEFEPLVAALERGDQVAAVDLAEQLLPADPAMDPLIAPKKTMLPEPWRYFMCCKLLPSVAGLSPLPGVYIVAQYCAWRAQPENAVLPVERDAWLAFHDRLVAAMKPLGVRKGRRDVVISDVMRGLLRQTYDELRAELRALKNPDADAIRNILSKRLTGWHPAEDVVKQIDTELRARRGRTWRPLRIALARWSGMSESEFRAQISDRKPSDPPSADVYRFIANQVRSDFFQ
jgi:hypothetical protein